MGVVPGPPAQSTHRRCLLPEPVPVRGETLDAYRPFDDRVRALDHFADLTWPITLGSGRVLATAMDSIFE